MTRESGIPIAANSKNPKVGRPAVVRAPVTITFGGVPIMVMVPPTLAAIASGISSLEAGIFAAWQIPMMTGIRHATVPVLEDTEDSTMVTIMIAAISGISLVPAFLTKRTTVELERPAYTALDGSTPRIPSMVHAAIAVTASGISSVMKRNAATARTHSVIIAGSIIFTFLCFAL